MEENRVIESFLGNEVYPLNTDLVEEGDGSVIATAIGTLATTAAMFIIPWVGKKIAQRKADKATTTETPNSIHLTGFKKKEYDEGLKYMEAAKAAAEKARGLTSGNPEIAELKKVYDENIEKHRELVKNRCTSLAYFSGSDISRLMALVRRYSWFRNGTIRPEDQKSAITEMEIHISREKQYKYDKYWMAFLHKFVNAVKSVEGQKIWISITN